MLPGPLTGTRVTETRVIEARADAAAAGQRLDRFLAELSGLSRSRVKALIEAGHVSADDSVLSEPAAGVRVGVCYRLDPPEPVAATPEPQAIGLDILFEDDDLIVLDKPAGLVVHPAPGNEDGTLVNALLAHCGDSLPGLGGEKRPGIVHRLDRDTSGVMVVAKTEPALAALGRAFADRSIARHYLALVWGVASPTAGEIEGDIGRDPRDRKRMAVVARNGKPALTRYRTLESYAAAASLVECRLATGRTHQIRVHLSTRGHPLIGDPVYLRRRPAVAKLLPAQIRDACLDFPRQALHAASLGFVHPRGGAELRFETEPPEDFKRLKNLLSSAS